MAPFLVSFPFSLAPSLLTFSYCHSRVATRVFFFYILFSFDFFPLFLFFCIFSFPSLLSFFGAPFLSLFFLSLSLLLSFAPLILAPLLDPPRGCKRTLCTPQDTPLAFQAKLRLIFRILFRYTIILNLLEVDADFAPPLMLQSFTQFVHLKKLGIVVSVCSALGFGISSLTCVRQRGDDCVCF